MGNNFPGLHRMTNVTRLFTVLLLTAIGAASLVPLSSGGSGRSTAAPKGAGGAAVHSPTGSSPSPSSTITVPGTTVPTTVPATTIPAPAPVIAAPNGYGCGPALAYLRAHAAPGFTFACPAWADGHQAMTCVNVAGVCPGAMVIAVSTPCPAAYMNEASNSWVVVGKSNAALDPYGYCP